MAVYQFSDLQDKVLGWLDLGTHTSQAGSLILARVKDAISSANIERATQRRWPFMMNTGGPQTFTLNPNQADPRTYALPADFSRPVYFWNQQKHSPLLQYGEDFVPSRDYSGTGLIDDYYVSSPQYGGYLLRGGNIVLVWTPLAADTIQFEYLKQPIALTNDTDIPDVPYPYSLILVYDALLEMAIYDEDLDQSKVTIWKDKQTKYENALLTVYGQEEGQHTADRYQDWLPRE